MQKTFLRLILSLSIVFPIFVYGATESYIGTSLGLDFYSVIDDGSYTITEQLVGRALAKVQTLGNLGVGCPGIEYITELAADEKILNYGTINYARLTEALAASEKLQGKTLTIPVYQGLVMCLQERYGAIIQQKRKEVDALQKIASVGLYTDGDTSNSDYDLITDIDKINGILFSENLKYTGTRNIASASLGSFLGGKNITPLFPGVYPLIGSGTFSASGSVGTGTVSGSGTGISALIGAVCTTNDTSIPLDSIMDENFMNELGRILKGAGGVSGGYTRDPAHRDILSGSGATGSLTSANDFFDQKGSCGGIFCIDVRFIGGSQATLGGGKNRSIEGIIDKHSAILEPIAAGNLACQKMTKNMGQSPNAYLKLVKVFSGLKVIYMTKPQETKQFRSEVTPQTEADDLLRFQQCAYASAGLSTNLLSANGPRVGAYSTNSAMNTENFTRREIVTSPQDPSQNALGASCFDLYMDQGRTTYYASFMNNITEIEGFTRSIADTITILVNNGTTMDSKPSGC